MDKPVRIILIIIVIIAVANLALTFFQKSELKAIQSDIALSQSKISAAMKDIQGAELKIDSIQGNIGIYLTYLKKEKAQVDSLDLKKTADEQKYTKQIAALNKQFNATLASQNTQLTKMASLPEIEH